MRIKPEILYKKLCKGILFGILFLCLLNLSGCGLLSTIDEGLKANKVKSDDKYWTERNVPPVELNIIVSCPGKEENFNDDMRVSRCVYKYLEDADKTLLMKMFSKSVIDTYNDLESDVDELIDFYQQLDVSEIEMKSNSRYKVHKLDPSETIVEYTYRSEFVYDGERYEMDILFVRDSDSDKDILGVHGIKLRNRDTNEAVIVNTVSEDI